MHDRARGKGLAATRAVLAASVVLVLLGLLSTALCAGYTVPSGGTQIILGGGSLHVMRWRWSGAAAGTPATAASQAALRFGTGNDWIQWYATSPLNKAYGMSRSEFPFLPFGVMGLLVGVPTHLILRHHNEQRPITRPSICPKCRYPLHGMERCPECGTRNPERCRRCGQDLTNVAIGDECPECGEATPRSA